MRAAMENKYVLPKRLYLWCFSDCQTLLEHRRQKIRDCRRQVKHGNPITEMLSF